MIPNPIRKVLSSIQKHRVQSLIMGGQACVLYGAAEFSRDLDLVLLVEPDNVQRLTRLLDELEAECIAVPPFDVRHLEHGHAVHFRCQLAGVKGLRIDIMSKLRGVDDFTQLWSRRTTLQTDDGTEIHLLSLPDLVKAKKTQRDKDWPMTRRLLEADYFQNRAAPTDDQVRFWLREMRTPELLMEITKDHPKEALSSEAARPLLRYVPSGDLDQLQAALREEERQEQESDRCYWEPLKKELTELRRLRRN